MPGGSTSGSWPSAPGTRRSAPSWPRPRSRLARITAEIGSPAEAADQFRQAIALWDDLLGSQPDDRSTGRSWPARSWGGRRS